ncbi:MAG: M48 family metallopeptidase, partial [Planctomycetota bacterium]
MTAPRRDGSFLTLKAFIAVDLIIGFYLLVVALAVAMPFLLGPLGLIPSFLVLISAWPKKDYFLAPGPRLTAEEHPKLFEELEDVASSLGEAMPESVYLLTETNAWVSQRGGRALLGGGQRVMAIGLPLFQGLTVAELRGILAHEFGHFHGGDTKLVAWIYRTRVALSETVGNLAGAPGGEAALTIILLAISFLFWLYAVVFLRLTRSLGRQQELNADALAGELVGARTMASALRKVSETDTAFRRFTRNELLALMKAGFRPPVFEGFARFVRAGAVQDTVSERLEEELEEKKKNPYDTHPPLRERLAAFDEESAEEDAVVEGPPALTLLGDATAYEPLLLAHVSKLDARSLEALEPLAWDEVGPRVVLPKWEAVAREHAAALAGLTPGRFPDYAKDLVAAGRGFGKGGSKILKPEAAKRAALATFGAAL